jgi:hypothetical protein
MKKHIGAIFLASGLLVFNLHGTEHQAFASVPQS